MNPILLGFIAHFSMQILRIQIKYFYTPLNKVKHLYASQALLFCFHFLVENYNYKYIWITII